jgi:hypothetical protein
MLEKEMQARQQTTLGSFLEENDDALLVVNKNRDNEIIMMSKATKSVFSNVLDLLKHPILLQDSM